VAEQQAAKTTETEKSSTGRVVVEIKQQPRRGRGVHSAGGRRDDEKRPERAEAPPEAAGDTAPASG
jgi:hypothetical protein